MITTKNLGVGALPRGTLAFEQVASIADLQTINTSGVAKFSTAWLSDGSAYYFDPAGAAGGVTPTAGGGRWYQLPTVLFTKAGAIANADFNIAPPVGTIGYDTTNHKIFVKDAAADSWLKTGALT